jgi:hypothetical protein
MCLAIDFDEDFIDMPFIARLSSFLAQFLSIFFTKRPIPLPNRFMADCDASLSQYQFDIPKTEGKSGIEPKTVVIISTGKRKPL